MAFPRLAATLLPLALLAGCFRDTSPDAVARRFVDKYYVEIDQPAALKLAIGPAAARLQDELAGLVAERREGLEAHPDHPRIFYERLADRPAPVPGEREVEYRLSIDSAGVTMHKRAELQLRDQGGHWRVFRFAEADMAEVPP